MGSRRERLERREECPDSILGGWELLIDLEHQNLIPGGTQTSSSHRGRVSTVDLSASELYNFPS